MANQQSSNSAASVRSKTPATPDWSTTEKMVLTGVVYKIERGRVFLVLEEASNAGQKCWFGPLRFYDDTRVGDVIVGNLLSFGNQIVFNESKHHTMNVFIEDRE